MLYLTTKHVIENFRGQLPSFPSLVAGLFGVIKSFAHRLIALFIDIDFARRKEVTKLKC